MGMWLECLCLRILKKCPFVQLALSSHRLKMLEDDKDFHLDGVKEIHAFNPKKLIKPNCSWFLSNPPGKSRWWNDVLCDVGHSCSESRNETFFSCTPTTSPIVVASFQLLNCPSSSVLPSVESVMWKTLSASFVIASALSTAWVQNATTCTCCTASLIASSSYSSCTSAAGCQYGSLPSSLSQVWPFKDACQV